MKTTFHANFSLWIRLLIKKSNSRRFWEEGFVLCAVKHNGEIWALDRGTNTGALFAADGTLQRGICTDGQAVKFVKPEELTIEEQARLAGMFPKKL